MFISEYKLQSFDKMLNKPLNILRIYLLPWALTILLGQKGEYILLCVVALLIITHLLGCLLAMGIYKMGEKSIFKKLKNFLLRNQGIMYIMLRTLMLCIVVVSLDRLIANTISLGEPLSSLLINIAGAFVALILTFYIFSPKLHFYKSLALYKMEGDNAYGKILIENKSILDLYDVKVTLEFITEGNGITNTNKINLCNDTIPLFKGKLSVGDNCQAWHTQEPIPSEFMALEEDYIRCRIEATYSLTGMRFVKEHLYCYGDYRQGDYAGNNQFISI